MVNVIRREKVSKEKKLLDEYKVKLSLIIFFTLIIVIGVFRLFVIINDKSYEVDLNDINVLDQDISINYNAYNTALANKLNDVYGIYVYYGDNINLTNVDAVNISNESEIFSMLINLTNAFREYPENIIREIESKGYMLSVYLVDHFNSNMEALANRNSVGQFKIYISNTAQIVRVFHHEFFHILDYYIRLEKDENKVYENWYKYNPKDFVYTEDVSNLTGKYVYIGNSGAYFVSVYAKYSNKEDRAETFAEMLCADRNENFFNEGEYIRGKMDVIKEALIDSFSTITRNDNIVLK